MNVFRKIQKKKNSLVVFILLGLFALTAAAAASNFISTGKFSGSGNTDSFGIPGIRSLWGSPANGAPAPAAPGHAGAPDSTPHGGQGSPSSVGVGSGLPDMRGQSFNDLQSLNDPHPNGRGSEDPSPGNTPIAAREFSAPAGIGNSTPSPDSSSGTGGSLGSTGSSGPTDVIPVTPVPEPETYAMLLAGLALIGFTARRRKTPK